MTERPRQERKKRGSLWPGLFLALLVLTALPGRADELRLPPALPDLAAPPEAQAELGRMLFFDRRLSGDGTMSCAVCHVPELAFTDGRELSGAYPTNKHWRNTQSVINAGYLHTFFWDGRSNSLEGQAEGPMHAVFEMNLNPDYLVEKLREIPAYRELFRKAFDAPVTRAAVTSALAAFERTIVVNDSPFDRYLRGEQDALTPTARAGLAIFFGERGRCASCHGGSLLSDQKFHNLGVPESPELKNDPQRRATRNYFLVQMGLPRMEHDPGRFAVTEEPGDMGAFRTPPLRQVAETGPYMHNGHFETLEEVIDFYDRGGGSDPNLSPLMKPLGLSAGEKEALTAFLHSLSGTLRPIEAPALPGL